MDQQSENQPQNPIPTDQTPPHVQPPVAPTPENTVPITPQPVTPPSVVPQPPVQPLSQPTPFAAPTPPVPSAGKMKLWVGVAVAIVVLIIVALVVWLTVFRVSKTDYQKADTALDTIHKTYDTLASDLSDATSLLNDSDSMSKSAVAEQSTTLKKDLTTYNQQFDELSKLHALRDKDVKQKYDAAADQNKKFVQYVQSFADTLPSFATVASDCSADKADSIANATMSTLMPAYDAAIKPCTKDLEGVSKSPNASLATYASDVLSIYTQQRAALSKMIDAYNAQDEAGYKAAQSNFLEVSEKFANINTDKITEAAKNAEVSDQMTALSNVLKSKV